MADEEDIRILNENAELSIKKYNSKFKVFLLSIYAAANGAIKSVVDTRLKQATYDINKLKESINSNSGYGLNFLDLVFTFIPVAGGHIFEKIVTTFFKNKIALRVASYEQINDLIAREKWVKSMIDISSPSYKVFDNWASKLNREIDSKKNFRQTADFLNKYLEFSTPVINDYLQQLGQELFKKTNDKSLEFFSSYNPSSLIEYKTNIEMVLRRYKDSPSGIITHFLESAIDRELQNLECDEILEIFKIKANENKDYAKKISVEYEKKLKELPSPGQIEQFKIYLSEIFEALIWILIYGNPLKWCEYYDVSNNKYYTTPFRMGIPHMAIRIYEYKIKVNIPEEIMNHLLETFRPFPNDDNEEISKMTYDEYYEEKKKSSLNTSSFGEGVAFKRTHEIDLSKTAYPVTPEPVWDYSSRDYTYTETAFSHLVSHFYERYYKNISSLNIYFANIVAKHKV